MRGSVTLSLFSRPRAPQDTDKTRWLSGAAEVTAHTPPSMDVKEPGLEKTDREASWYSGCLRCLQRLRGVGERVAFVTVFAATKVISHTTPSMKVKE